MSLLRLPMNAKEHKIDACESFFFKRNDNTFLQILLYLYFRRTFCYEYSNAWGSSASKSN